MNTIPINRVAARVIFGKSEKYYPNKHITTKESSVPIEIHENLKESYDHEAFEDLAGRKFGRFEVIGLAKEYPGRWVVKCACGRYTMRRRKAIQNKSNTQDRCEHCRQLVYLKKKQYFKETGKDKDE